MSNLVVTIHSFVFAFILAESSSPSKASNLPSLSDIPLIQECIDFIKNNSLLSFLFLLIILIVLIINYLGTIIENFQNIRECCQQYLFRKQAEISEQKLLKLREQLLTRLQSDISIRRENFLHNLIKIDLEMEEQRHQVGGITFELVPEDTENSNPLNREFRSLNKDDCQTTQLKPTQKIIEFFDRNDIQGKLLILGEPGAGKTTELLSLAEDLIQRAIADKNAPIPIIFELSTWKNDQTIRDWLIEQLSEIYKGIPLAVAEQWLDNQQLIPLLDGLDELGLERQNKCIVALNEFLASSFQPGLVVCCRREEYEQAQNKLEQLNGAIYLQPLSDDQIQGYLQSLRRSSIWHNTIVNEPSLLELCRKPLFLTMLVVAYQGRAIKNFSELFEAYIEKQLNNPDLQGTYPPRKSPSQKRTLHYLIWLARKLEAEREPEFLIEGMQPTWLESTKQKIVYRVFGGLMGGLSVGLIGGLMGGLMGGLSVGLMGGRENIIPVEKLNFSFKEAMNSSIDWLIDWLMGGLMGELSSSEIENKNFPNQGIWNSLKNGLIFGLIFGLMGGLIFGLMGGLIDGLFFGLIFGVFFWLIFGLMGGLIFGLFFGLFFGLIGVLRIGGLMDRLFFGLMGGLFFGLIFGLRGGLMGGLLAVIQHFTLRLIIYRNGDIPWNYAKFLDHAAKHRFIQRVGGRYRFMHDLLRKHFAQMPLS